MKLAVSKGVEPPTEQQNVAGSGARMMARERRFARRWICCITFVALGCMLWIEAHNLYGRNVIALLCCMAGLLVIDRRIIPDVDLLQKRENDAIRGAGAEEAVGAILERLPNDYVVLHDVAARCGNIDHVILRKDGAVFVLETKSMVGRVIDRNGNLLVNGKPPKKDFLRQARGNAMWVRDALAAELGVTPWVNAVVVFPNASVFVRGTIAGVAVASACSLERWLVKVPGQCEIARRATFSREWLRRTLMKQGRPSRSVSRKLL